MLHWNPSFHGKIQEEHRKKHNRKGSPFSCRSFHQEDENGKEFYKTPPPKELQEQDLLKRCLKACMV